MQHYKKNSSQTRNLFLAAVLSLPSKSHKIFIAFSLGACAHVCLYCLCLFTTLDIAVWTEWYETQGLGAVKKELYVEDDFFLSISNSIKWQYFIRDIFMSA